MPRPARNKLSPWIESLILGYDSREGGGGSGSGRLKAHVIGVGPMSQSQVQDCESPTMLLFLSDGALQIPAILTASAWEHLQEVEERECFTSLVNTTVYIQDYRLQFHMAHEQTKSRFFLSVGELATTAAGPAKENTPCCTTLPSVRQKICQTWRVLLGQEALDSQKSQCGFDLSELLGEWQHDCLQAVLEDVRERLIVSSPQASTSTSIPMVTHPGTSTTTSWDIDRIKYKGLECFIVPVKCLLIPEEDVQQPHTPHHVESSKPSELPAVSEEPKSDFPQLSKASEATQPSVDDDVDWRIAKPAESHHDASNSSPLPVKDSMHEIIIDIIDCDIRPLTNPWDIFPPCDTSSSSGTSPAATPPHPQHSPTAAECQQDPAAILTSSTQCHGLSYLPPYQKPPQSANLPVTASSTPTSVSLPGPSTNPSNLLPSSEKHQTDNAQQVALGLDPECQILEDMEEETVVREGRKSCKPTPESLNTSMDKDGQVSGSPPSWLYDTQAGSRAKEGSHDQQDHTVEAVLRDTPTVHSNGRPFSYSYQVTRQNQEDLSRFQMDGSWLHWAVKYLLVPNQTDDSQQ